MQKSDIIKHLYKQGYPTWSKDKFSEKEIKNVVDAIFNCITREVTIFGARVEIRGFGMFSLRKRAAGKKVNPRYGTKFDSGESYKMYFRPSRKLNERLSIDL